jgi:hypothetical protein
LKISFADFLSSEEECDAREVNCSSAAGYKKLFKNYLFAS